MKTAFPHLLRLGFLLGGGLGAFLTTAWAQTPPVIRRDIDQPQDQTVSLGARAEFRVVAVGSTPLRYQWRHDGAPIALATNRVLTLAEVRLQDGGGYDVVITNDYGELTSRTALLTADPTFTKITTGALVTDTAGSIGMAWFDWNNDGYLDAFFGNPSQNAFYENQGDGSFVKRLDITPGISRASYSGCAADYNNDGWQDLFVVRLNGEANQLFRNLGGTDFANVGYEEAGSLVSDRRSWACASCADYDRDGRVDLFVGNRNTENDCLYRNNGDGSFSSMTGDEAGDIVRDAAYTEACAWADYDNDGWADLWVVDFSWEYSPAKGKNTLYHNEGHGVFSRVTEGSVSEIRSFGAGAWGDYDNDGYLDLFLGGYHVSNSLHKNVGGQAFVNVTAQAGVGLAMTTWTSAWGDYDNDGFLDLFVAAYDFPPHTSVLYHNNGDQTFSTVDVGSPNRDGVHRVNVSWLDFDNDGFLDLCLACGDAAVQTPNLLYRNNGNSNHWLQCRFVGTESNRDALGAKVRLKATIDGQERWQTREVGIGGSHFGPHSLITHFGLGDAAYADVVRIEWPSGIVQELKDVPANQILTVLEPPKLVPQDAGKFQIQCWINQSFEVQCSADLEAWSPAATLTNLTGTLVFEDVEADQHGCRYYRVLAN
jgi:enediyne biosynthesis protein E4